MSFDEEEIKRWNERLELETEWLLAFANLGKTPGKFAPPFRKTLKKPKRLHEEIDSKLHFPLPARYPLEDADYLSEHGVGAIRPKLPLTAEGKTIKLPYREFWEWAHKTGKLLGCGWWAPFPGIHVYLEKEEKYIKMPGAPGSKIIGDHGEAINGVYGEFKKEIGEGDATWDKAYRVLNWYWILTIITLESIADGGSFDRDDILSQLLYSSDNRPIPEIRGENIFFVHKGEFPQLILAFLMNFKMNQKTKHSHLRQCPTCGTFWLTRKKRGRVRVFCVPACEDRFNMPTRKQRREYMTENRKDPRVRSREEKKKKEHQEKDYKEIIKLSQQKEYGGNSEKDSTEIAKKWVYIDGKTLKQFLETF
jgi:uncharacterized Zn finger protein (UPF0148 family)